VGGLAAEKEDRVSPNSVISVDQGAAFCATDTGLSSPMVVAAAQGVLMPWRAVDPANVNPLERIARGGAHDFAPARGHMLEGAIGYRLDPSQWIPPNGLLPTGVMFPRVNSDQYLWTLAKWFGIADSQSNKNAFWSANNRCSRKIMSSCTLGGVLRRTRRWWALKDARWLAGLA
jgi:hypothetical protein